VPVRGLGDPHRPQRGRLARLHTAGDGPLAVAEPPFGEVVLAEAYWFLPDRLADPAHQWLFARLDEAGAALPAGAT
jgi:hypothetical protein